MEITLHQEIYYSNKDFVPIREVADALIALESIIKQTPPVLECLFPDTTIKSVEVFIDKLESGSLSEKLVVKFIFGSQENFDQFIDDLRKRVGMDKIMSNPSLFTSIILIMIFVGVMYLLNNSKQERTTIEANNTTIINISADALGLEASELEAIVNGAIPDKNRLARDAISFIKPAKNDPLAYITFNGDDNLSINAETIKSIPGYLKDIEQEEIIEDHDAINIEIRATDLDSKKKGWAVIVPDLGSKRIRLHLDPVINQEELIGKRVINGNVTVVFEYDDHYRKVPKLVFLRKIND